MYIIIALLLGCQSSILSPNEWHNDMNPAFISTIMAELGNGHGHHSHHLVHLGRLWAGLPRLLPPGLWEFLLGMAGETTERDGVDVATMVGPHTILLIL